MPGFEIERSETTIGKEPAVLLDKGPGQDINQLVFFVHGDRLYYLMLAPAAETLGALYQDMLALYDLATQYFAFLPHQMKR